MLVRDVTVANHKWKGDFLIYQCDNPTHFNIINKTVVENRYVNYFLIQFDNISDLNPVPIPNLDSSSIVLRVNGIDYVDQMPYIFYNKVFPNKYMKIYDFPDELPNNVIIYPINDRNCLNVNCLENVLDFIFNDLNIDHNLFKFTVYTNVRECDEPPVYTLRSFTVYTSVEYDNNSFNLTVYKNAKYLEAVHFYFNTVFDDVDKVVDNVTVVNAESEQIVYKHLYCFTNSCSTVVTVFVYLVKLDEMCNTVVKLNLLPEHKHTLLKCEHAYVDYVDTDL